MNISMLERKINRENPYKLKPVSELKKGDKIPLVQILCVNVNVKMYKKENEEGEEFTKKLKYIHIYLPNIKKKYYNKEKLSVLERLLLTFN